MKNRKKTEKTEWDLLLGYLAGLWIITTMLVGIVFGGINPFRDIFTLIMISGASFSGLMILIGTRISDNGNGTVGSIITIIFSFTSLIGFGGMFIGTILGIIGGFKQMGKKRRKRK